MANVVPFSFGISLLSGHHDFANSGNTFKIALYTAGSGAPYTTSSTVYSSGVANEVGTGSGSQYATGGNTLLGQAVANQTNVATVDFTDTVWGSGTPATFSAAYAVIYNSSTVDSTANRLVVVLDFNGTKSCSNGTFTITFPNPASGSPAGSDAIISITS
jgi:hypothetical protein